MPVASRMADRAHKAPIAPRRRLLVYYDDYHTPIDALADAVGEVDPVSVGFGGNSVAATGHLAAEHFDRSAWFADHFLARAIRANGWYQQHYNLSAALSRPALAVCIAGIARERGSETVVHGFAGNDRLRFESALAALLPGVAIHAVSDLLGSRTEANAQGFTRSANIWGETLEAGPLGDPAHDSAAFVFAGQGNDSAQRTIEIGFERGLPVAIDGTAMGLAELIAMLTQLGTENGLPWHDLVEDGHVGLKTRALYHSPAADILAAAHSDLVRFTGSRRQNRFRPLAEASWAELVYEGGWFDPLRATLDAFFEAADAHVTGSVTVALCARAMRVVGRRSDAALYDEGCAVYRAGEDFGAALIAGLRDQESHLAGLALAREDASPCTD